MTASLSMADVNRLLSDPSAQTRAETVAKIADQFDQSVLKESERRLAEDIFRSMVKDAEQLVRESLSQALKSCPDVPHDVALALARDVEAVSLPMLKFSEVLTDDDLVEIVRSQGPAKQAAIAQRETVSARVADAVIDTGNAHAVAKLVSNAGAELTESALDKVMTNYEASTDVSDSLSRRANLPPAIQEQLVNALTEKMKDVLSDKHELPIDKVTNMLLQARERATITLLNHGSSEAELERMVQQMHVNGRLTASVVLRALAMGDMAFFEMSLARLAGIPVQNARILIHDQGSLGLRSLCQKAHLPDRLFPAFRAGVDVADSNDYDGGPNDRERYVARMVERMLTQFSDPAERINEDDIDYLIGKLNAIAA